MTEDHWLRQLVGHVIRPSLPNHPDFELAKTLLPKIYEHVDPRSNIYTDAHRAYWDLQYTRRHYFVNHVERYVNGVVHTNHVENFWCLLRRTLNGTYVSVRPKHLMRYVEEQVFRFNERERTDGERFPIALKGADGKRVTYKQLTGKA